MYISTRSKLKKQKHDSFCNSHIQTKLVSRQMCQATHKPICKIQQQCHLILFHLPVFTVEKRVMLTTCMESIDITTCLVNMENSEFKVCRRTGGYPFCSQNSAPSHCIIPDVVCDILTYLSLKTHDYSLGYGLATHNNSEMNANA